ncbi:hypothetical protein ElyMa_002443800 [Elysia marginata]|uniref:WAP domain-containing protein n=1 Tax=Elysia marginata TaxID=1093978 RepID=A0AAV4GJP9_9GAST|nr:hypothetical protein ElyMa_002443800 [Elysia marginata]
MDCNNQLYLMALLVPTPTMTGFKPMECKNPNFYTTCPAGSTCVANSRSGRFTCCTGIPTKQGTMALTSRVDAKMVQKAGVCPAVS